MMSVAQKLQSCSIATRAQRVVETSASCCEKTALAFAKWRTWIGEYVKAAGSDPHDTGVAIDFERGFVLRDGEVIVECEDPRSLRAAADWHMTRDWAQHICERYLVAHSAVVERDGKALMLVGEQGAGKSTLALALVQSGYRYLSDEFAVVDPETLKVLPMPNGLTIKDPVGQGFSAASEQFEILPYPSAFRPPYDHAVCGLPFARLVPSPGESFPIRWIAFVKAEQLPDVAFRLDAPIAAMRLFNVSAHASSEQVLRTVAGAARIAELWEINRQPIQRMVEWVLRSTNGGQVKP